MTNRRFVLALGAMLAGLLIWAAHFTVIYGITSLDCARPLFDGELFGIGSVSLAIGIATALGVLATAVVLVASIRHLGPRPSERDAAAAPHFIRWMTAAVAGLSLVAILWEGLTAAIIPACA